MVSNAISHISSAGYDLHPEWNSESGFQNNTRKTLS